MTPPFTVSPFTVSPFNSWQEASLADKEMLFNSLAVWSFRRKKQLSSFHNRVNRV